MSTKSTRIVLLVLLLAGILGYLKYNNLYPFSAPDSTIIIADDGSISQASKKAIASAGPGIYFYRPGNGSNRWTSNDNGSFTATIANSAAWTVADKNSEDLSDGSDVLVPTATGAAAPAVSVLSGMLTVGPDPSNPCTLSAVDTTLVFCPGTGPLSKLRIPKEHTKPKQNGHDHTPKDGVFTLSPHH